MSPRWGRRRGRNTSANAGTPARGTIVLSASTVSLTQSAGSATTVTGQVSVGNSGAGSLAGIHLGAISYVSGSGWLSASVIPGYPATLTVTANAAALGAGTYSATIPVQDTNATNSPQTLTVSFVVTAVVAPTIVLSNPTMALSVQQGNAATASATCTVTSGTAAGLGTLSIGTVTGTGSTGVSATVSGNVVTVTGASAALTSASSPYTATVPVVDATASNTPQNITVTLNVTAVSPPPTPTMALSASSVTWSATEGSNATRSATITVTSSNGATLGTTTVGTVTGTASSAISTSVTGHDVTITFNVGSLAAGSYGATVPILDSLASNSPQNVTLSITVDPVSSTTYDVTASVNLLASTAGAGVFVGGGFPLRQGDLMPSDLTARKFAVFVSGVEQSVYVEAMPGRFPDGSVRAVLVQFVYDIPSSTPIAAQVKLRTTRNTTDRAKVSMTPDVVWAVTVGGVWGEDGDIKAKLLPTDPTYLCATDATFQPLIPSSQMTAAEVARFDTFAQARASSLRTQTINKVSSSVQLFQSTYDSPRALLAMWQRTGDVAWYQDAMRLLYRLIEYTMQTPTYNGWSPNANMWGEVRFQQASGTDTAEQYSQRLWSYAAGWQLSGYAPFYSRVNTLHQHDNSATRATYAGATQVNSLGYILQYYGMRLNVFKATRHIVAYTIGANRRTSAPSGYGNRDMNFPVELPLIIDAWYVNQWNRVGDWRNGVVGVYYGNTDGARNAAPDPEDFPTFQLSLANHFLMAYEREVYADSRIPGMIKTNVNALLTHTRALVSGDTGFGTASYGSPYWMVRSAPASQGYAGTATPVYLCMDASAIAYCAARWPADVVNGATYATWYGRVIDPNNNANNAALQNYDWTKFDRGWKIFGEQFGNSQCGPYFMRNGVPTGPSTINSLAVPTSWPV